MLAFLAVEPVAAGGEVSTRQGIPGPIPARVLRVIDGDTVAVRATIWPGQHIEVSVRLADIDAPEMRSRCKSTRDRARRGRTLLHNLIAGTTVTLHDVRHGKYAGRVVARMQSASGIAIADHLVEMGAATPWQKRRKTRARFRARCDQKGTVVVLRP